MYVSIVLSLRAYNIGGLSLFYDGYVGCLQRVCLHVVLESAMKNTGV